MVATKTKDKELELPVDGPLFEQEEADAAAADAAEADRELPVEEYLRLPKFAEYLLERTGKQRLGQRRSFTNNLLARYLAYYLGGEWLVTSESAMNADTMATIHLPRWAKHVIVYLAAPEDEPNFVTVDAALRVTLQAAAGELDELSRDDDMPF